MNPDQFAAKIREIRILSDHARDRMRAYAPGCLMRSYWEGMHTGLKDAIKTFEADLPPFELRRIAGGVRDE